MIGTASAYLSAVANVLATGPNSKAAVEFTTG
jgi:hypothetical protein